MAHMCIHCRIARLVAVGVLVGGVPDVVQLLPDGCVLRPQGLRGLGQEPRAVGQLGGVRRQLVELQLRATGGQTRRPDKTDSAVRVLRYVVRFNFCRFILGRFSSIRFCTWFRFSLARFD